MAIYYNPKYSFVQAYKTNGLAGLVGNSPADPNWRIDFEPDTTLPQKQVIIIASQSWDWQPLPKPQLANFYNAIWADSTLTSISKTGLVGLLTPLNSFIMNYAAISVIQEAWQTTIQNPPSWLTPQAVDIIQAYAVEFKVPLLP